jgi:hypothetical protein
LEDEEMKYKAAISVLATGVLILSSTAIFAQHGPPGGHAQPQDRAQAERGQQSDRDRLRDRDRIEVPSHDRDRVQDRTHVPDFAKLSDQDIYGSEVMSVQERNEYRYQLQNANSEKERQQIEARHREMVMTKAQSQGVDLAPPGKGIYGGAIMSVEERNRYREELRMIGSEEERLQFMAQHREEMQIRAKAQGIELE